MYLAREEKYTALTRLAYHILDKTDILKVA